jgi:hypothetical protein
VKTIAIDYDDTYTTDPSLWNKAIALFQEAGWRVLCVTCRRDTEENVADVRPPCSVVFTGLSPKKWFMETRRDVKVDVWVDDDPNSIINGH